MAMLGALTLLESPSLIFSHFRLGSVTFWSYPITLVRLNFRGTRNYKNSRGSYTHKIKLKIRKVLLSIDGDFLHALFQICV